MSDTSYITVEKEADDSFVEKRSKFIGYCRSVSTQQEALDFINRIKAKHWDARHNVYAYCLRENQVKRYSDDGEPQGTAGMPVLEAMTKNNVTDAVVVVTRYFGGVLLGTGGLVRAYSHSAVLALQAAGIVKMEQCLVCSLSCDYNQYGKASALIPQCGGVIDNSDFGTDVSIDFHINSDGFNTLSKQLAEATCGQAEPKENGREFFAVKE